MLDINKYNTKELSHIVDPKNEEEMIAISRAIKVIEAQRAELEQLQEIAKAKADGRLVMLPCKVGDEIFSFKWSIKNEKYEVHTGKVKNVRYDSSDGLVTVSDGERYCVFGKTVFLTREEAEKALGGGGDA